MAYPDDALPMVVEIAPGADPAGDPGDWSWTDVTTSVRLSDRIVIEAGRGNWGDRVDAGTCALTFNNPTGDFSEHNPLGQWYGQLGRNTPLRVRLRRGEDDFGRTEASGWGTAPSGQTWATSGGSAANYSVAAGIGYHSHATVNVLRRSVLDVDLVDVEQVVDVATSAMLTGAALVTGVLVRHQDANNYYWLRAEFDHGGTDVILKISKTVAGVTTQLAVLDPVPGLAYAAGTPVRIRAGVDGPHLRIKVWDPAGAETAGWMLTATDTALTGPGAAGVQTWLVGGNTNPLPVTVAHTNYQLLVDLAGGYVPAWVPRTDLTGKIRTVPVTARGVLSRLHPDQSTPPTRSPLRRTITAANPAAYWPVEDGTLASQAASTISGHPAMTVTGSAEFRAVEDYISLSAGIDYGTVALADLATGGRLTATLPPTATAATATAWTVHVAASVDPGSASGDVTLLEWSTPGGTYVRWRLVATTGFHTQVLAYNTADTEFLMVDVATVPAGFAEYAVSCYQWAGPNITVDLYLASTTPSGTVSTAATCAGVVGVTANPRATTSTVEMPFGHIAVWASSAPPIRLTAATDGYGTITGSAWASWLGETATDRLARLTAEDGITLTMPAVTADCITRMGSQPAGTPLDLYQRAVDADAGILAERPYALTYTPREQLYNQAPAMTLTSTQLGAAPEADPADQRYRNRIQVERDGGSSVVAQTDDVANGAVVYDQSVKLSLSRDTQLVDQAGWRLHLASSREPRWPRLSLNLQAVPALIDAWLNCRPGSRILVTDPPVDVAGQDIDVLIEGYTLTLGYKDFDVDANCSPGRLWDIAVADGDQRTAADGSTLAAAITASATSLSLATTSTNGVWTTDASDFPLDLRIGGEQVTVSAIAGTTSPQTATVSARAVNGISRSWPAGTEVDVWDPAIVPL